MTDALRFRLWQFYWVGLIVVFLVGLFLLGWYFGYQNGLTACKATCTEALKQYGLVVEGYTWK